MTISEEFKLLGVKFDCELKSQEHTKNVTSKANKEKKNEQLILY